MKYILLSFAFLSSSFIFSEDVQKMPSLVHDFHTVSDSSFAQTSLDQIKELNPELLHAIPQSNRDAIKPIGFLEKIVGNPKPVILHFYAGWCNPCKRMKPIFEQIAFKNFGKIDCFKVNTETDPQLIKELFKIKVVPTFIYFKDGKEVARTNSVTEEQMLGIIHSKLSPANIISLEGVLSQYDLPENTPEIIQNECPHLAGNLYEGMPFEELAVLNFIAHHKNKGIIVKLYGNWCGDCKKIHRQLEKYAREYSDSLLIVDINIELINPKLLQRYNIEQVPTLIFLKDGKEVHRGSTLSNAQLISHIKHIIS